VEDLLLSDTDGFFRALEAFARFPPFEAIGCRLNIPERPQELLRQAYGRVSEVVRGAGKEVIFFSRASEQIHREWFDFFSLLKVPFLLEYEKSLRTVRKAVGIANKWERHAQRTRGFHRQERRGIAVLRGNRSMRDGQQLPIRETLLLFREYGIPFACTEIATSAGEAVELAEAIGFPVVLKVSSVDIAHRSDIGAVKTNLRARENVRSAYEEILGICRATHPAARIEGVLIQPMIEAVAEVLLGIVKDPQIGPVTLLGTGGIFVEVLKDTVIRVPPLDLQDCDEMIEGLRGKALLAGTRGRPAGDLKALSGAILSLSRLALDLEEEIDEIDLNPVMVLPEGKGVTAVDGLVILTTSKEKGG